MSFLLGRGAVRRGRNGIDAEIVAVDRREAGSVLDLLKKDLKEADKLKFKQQIKEQL